MTVAEKNAFLGRSKNVNKHHKPKYQKTLPSDFKMKPVNELPTTVDWRTAGVTTSVKDQGYCGYCFELILLLRYYNHCYVFYFIYLSIYCVHQLVYDSF